MKTYTAEEVTKRTNAEGSDWCHDNRGQVVLYTNIFLWSDGSYRDEPDPSYEDDGI